MAQKLLEYDPIKRISATDALETSFFKVEEPPPELPVEWVVFFILLSGSDSLSLGFVLRSLASLEGEWHEFESKRERAKKRRKTEPGPTNEMDIA